MKVALFIGQSLGVEMFSMSSGGATPASGTHMWNGTGWIAPTGDGAIAYCNDIKTALGEDVYVINTCLGGASLLPVTGVQCWTDTSVGSLINTAMATTHAALTSLPCGTILDRIEFIGCQSDAMANTYGYSALLAGFDTLDDILRGGLGNDFRLCIWPVGKVVQGSTMEVNRAMLAYADANVSTCEAGPCDYDLTFRDGLHLDTASYAAKGMRGARNVVSWKIAKDNNALTIPHMGSGPRVSAVKRFTAANLNVFMLDVAVKPGCCLSPGNAWSGTVTLSGFGAWWANSYDSIALTDQKLVGGRIRLETGGTIINGCVRGGYWWERGCSAGSPVYDSNDQFFPGWGQPMLPHCPEMMASN